MLEPQNVQNDGNLQKGSVKQVYTQPHLESLGSVTDLTQSTSYTYNGDLLGADPLGPPDLIS